jgi:MFS superfamily sulfate permease-like transporter
MRARSEERAGGFGIGLGEVSGAVADLGILVPLAAALVLVNGLDGGAVLLCAGLLYLCAGLWFKVPFPVQPLKALAAIAVAEGLHPGVIHAAGLEMGALLLFISVGGVANVVARIFTKPVIRALQLGVGILLAIAAWKLVANPPDVFSAVPSSPWPVVLAVLTFGGVWWAARHRRYWAALAILAAGIVGTAIAAHPDLAGPAFHLPSLRFPRAAAFGNAFWLLVIPQFPLTFGNAVVAVDDLSHEYFGPAARRVSPSRICISDGLGNVASGLLGGMPMCHGAGGLTAHVKLGARTAGMNLLLGGVLVALGLSFGPQIPVLLGLLPVWGLAGLLAYAGLRHASLVGDLRGAPLLIAVACGILGALLGNLAITAAVALVADHGRRRLPNQRGEIARAKA